MPSPSLLSSIKAGCRHFASSSTNVVINKDALLPFVQTKLASTSPKRLAITVPLRFNSPAHQINFHCILAALSFGSGYRSECKKIIQRSPHNTILYGVMSMVIGGGSLEADYFNHIGATDVQMIFNVPLDMDVPHESIPGLYISKPSPLRPFVEKVARTITECGRRLSELQCKDFSQYLDKLAERHNGSLDLNDFLAAISRDFPAFYDSNTIAEGVRLDFMSKAQRLASDLALAAAESPAVTAKLAFFHFEQFSQLSVFADDILAAVLEREGIIEYGAELARCVENGKTVPHGVIEAEARACVLAACEEILDLAGRDKLSGPDLDEFLRRMEKEEGAKDEKRYICKDTIAY